MDSLNEHGLVEPIKRMAASGTPMLGICLGMQLLHTRVAYFQSTCGHVPT